MADFSPTRTHATWKPRVTAAHVPFFRCKTCGHVFAALDHGGEITLRNDGERSLIKEPPYSNAAENLWNSLSQFLTKKSKTRLN